MSLLKENKCDLVMSKYEVKNLFFVSLLPALSRSRLPLPPPPAVHATHLLARFARPHPFASHPPELPLPPTPKPYAQCIFPLLHHFIIFYL